jgi:hypothetical protein
MRVIVGRLVHDEGVLHIGARVGDAPPDPVVVAQHDGRHAGKRGADHRVGRADMHTPTHIHPQYHERHKEHSAHSDVMLQTTAR